LRTKTTRGSRGKKEERAGRGEELVYLYIDQLLLVLRRRSEGEGCSFPRLHERARSGGQQQHQRTELWMRVLSRRVQGARKSPRSSPLSQRRPGFSP
jgi:hypothetical protein